MSKKRRKLRPHETARRDQELAWARETAKNPDMGVIVQDHAQPGGWCVECGAPALYVIHLLYGTPQQRTFRGCELHYRRAVNVITAALAGDPQVEFGPTWMDES